MAYQFSHVLIMVTTYSWVSAQTPGKDFICLTPDTCITNTTAGNIIDPRIVIPVETAITKSETLLCPSGKIECYGLVGGGSCGKRYATNIINTYGPSTYGAFPWQAYIKNQSDYIGSGVLVDANHILTAAHKVYQNKPTPKNLQVYMGIHNPSNLTNTQQRIVDDIQIHPNFSQTTLQNDIAVIRLTKPVHLGYEINVGTACLPVASANYVGHNCTVSGWGQTKFGLNDSATLPQRQVTVPIVSYAACRASMSQPNVLGGNVDIFLDANELCAGGQANRDACTQDGGAPLVCENAGTFTVAGLVIWGKNCGQPGVYGVYVNVAKYINWINKVIDNFKK